MADFIAANPGLPFMVLGVLLFIKAFWPKPRHSDAEFRGVDRRLAPNDFEISGEPPSGEPRERL